jgi:hypothetical protein
LCGRNARIVRHTPAEYLTLVGAAPKNPLTRASMIDVDAHHDPTTTLFLEPVSFSYHARNGSRALWWQAGRPRFVMTRPANSDLRLGWPSPEMLGHV